MGVSWTDVLGAHPPSAVLTRPFCECVGAAPRCGLYVVSGAAVSAAACGTRDVHAKACVWPLESWTLPGLIYYRCYCVGGTCAWGVVSVCTVLVVTLASASAGTGARHWQRHSPHIEAEVRTGVWTRVCRRRSLRAALDIV